MNKSKSIILLTSVLILFTGNQAFSQKDTTKLKTNKENAETYYEQESHDIEDQEEAKDKIFIHVKNMPEFPGGINALKSFIAKNIKYPTVAKENGTQGTVYLRIEVKKTGEIGKIELQRGVDPLLNKEAIRVIKTLPKFKPGELNGKKVNVWYSIPVTFKLN